ncbi:MAG: putative basic amino acid antiporter YfcC [Anaerolineales bacterium]
MESKPGAHISTRAFLQSVVILFVLMLAAGVLTRVLPAGAYQRTLEAGREMLVPNSFQFTARPDYPIWRWLTAPVEVLWAPGNIVVITIILFILMVGGAFAVLDASGILRAGIARIVRWAGGRKYLLLVSVSFFFMAVGAFFGIFEEIVPLVPVMVALSFYLGWDSLVGLGMSILATNMGFSAAITNPFTIGVAQKIAELPLFSGAWLRLIIFLTLYTLLALFLVRYAKKVERAPETSAVYDEDKAERARFAASGVDFAAATPGLGKAMAWFGVCVLLIVLTLVAGPFVPVLSDFALPIVGLLFLVGGVGAGLIAQKDKRAVWKALGQGIGGIAPGIVLILMAVSIKHIVVSGGVMDTILHYAARPFTQASPALAALAIYGVALVMEVFVASGSAKAFLMMPILIPLADLVGITRQVTVTAYCFGDGFSNLMYPTNPVLLIVLGLTSVTYAKWLKWSLPLWVWVIVATVAFLLIGTAIGYGPF